MNEHWEISVGRGCDYRRQPGSPPSSSVSGLAAHSPTTAREKLCVRIEMPGELRRNDATCHALEAVFQLIGMDVAVACRATGKPGSRRYHYCSGCPALGVEPPPMRPLPGASMCRVTFLCDALPHTSYAL